MIQLSPGQIEILNLSITNSIAGRYDIDNPHVLIKFLRVAGSRMKHSPVSLCNMIQDIILQHPSYQYSIYTGQANEPHYSGPRQPYYRSRTPVEAVRNMTHRRRMIQCSYLPILFSSIIDTERITDGINHLVVKCIGKKEFAGIVCFVGHNRNIEVVCIREC